MFFLTFIMGLVFAEPYIAVLQSDSFTEYQIPTTAFIKNCTVKTKAYDIHGSREIGLQRIAELQRQKPAMVFAVGAKAAWLAHTELPNVPLVYTMVQNPERFGLKDDQNIEVAMYPPQDLSIAQMQLFFPTVEHIAFFSSDNPSDAVSSYIKLMESYGFKISLIKADTTNELRKKLADLSEDIDIIWLAKDHLWLTPERFYHINNTAIKKNIPVVSNSSHLSRAGALLSISSKYDSIGMVAAKMLSAKVLEGTPIEKRKIYTQELYITLNRKTQKALGIELEPYMIDFINEEILE